MRRHECVCIGCMYGAMLDRRARVLACRYASWSTAERYRARGARLQTARARTRVLDRLCCRTRTSSTTSRLPTVMLRSGLSVNQGTESRDWGVCVCDQCVCVCVLRCTRSTHPFFEHGAADGGVLGDGQQEDHRDVCVARGQLGRAVQTVEEGDELVQGVRVCVSARVCACVCVRTCGVHLSAHTQPPPRTPRNTHQAVKVGSGQHVVHQHRAVLQQRVAQQAARGGGRVPVQGRVGGGRGQLRWCACVRACVRKLSSLHQHSVQGVEVDGQPRHARS